MKMLTVIAFLFAPLFAEAAVVGPCGSLNAIDYIVEPWEQNTRTFYNGKVRIVNIDTYGEPTCCSSHLAILLPQNDELETVACYVFSQRRYEGDEPYYLGFQNVDVRNVTAKYDPAQGLLLQIPYTSYIDGIDSKRGSAKVRLNLKTGKAKIE
jgi:hypothetical protein